MTRPKIEEDKSDVIDSTLQEMSETNNEISPNASSCVSDATMMSMTSSAIVTPAKKVGRK